MKVRQVWVPNKFGWERQLDPINYRVILINVSITSAPNMVLIVIEQCHIPMVKLLKLYYRYLS